MNILIVHAHPESQSFSGAMFRVACDFLREQGHSVETSDLYAMAFNPIASGADFSERSNPDYLVYALEQRQAIANHSIAEDILREVEKVQKAELIILNFPIYWFSVPAILKGWIDRVFVSGIFYGGKRIYANGGMSGKQALLSITTGGRKDMLSGGGIHGDIVDMLKPVLQGTLGYVGMEVLTPFCAYHVPYISEDERAKILENWRHVLANIHGRDRLQMPDLSHFDDRFRPV